MGSQKINLSFKYVQLSPGTDDIFSALDSSLAAETTNRTGVRVLENALSGHSFSGSHLASWCGLEGWQTEHLEKERVLAATTYWHSKICYPSFGPSLSCSLKDIQTSLGENKEQDEINHFHDVQLTS